MKNDYKEIKKWPKGTKNNNKVNEHKQHDPKELKNDQGHKVTKMRHKNYQVRDEHKDILHRLKINTK